MATEKDESKPLFGRRSVLKAFGSGVVAGSIFATTAAAGDDAFATQLTTVRSFTRKYRDIATARADGYEFFAALPPVGHIFANPEFVGNTGLTESPSLLFYAPNRSDGPTDESGLILAGLEYHVPGDRTADPPNMFADETASRRLKVTEADSWHRSPIPDVLDVTGLHVWVHLPNPAGVFHNEHPTIERMMGD